MFNLDATLEATQWDRFWMPDNIDVIDRPALLAVAHRSGRRELNCAMRLRPPYDLDAVARHHPWGSRVLVVPGGGPGLADALAARGYAPRFEGDAFGLDVTTWSRPIRFATKEVRDLSTLRDLHAVRRAAFDGPPPTEDALALELSQLVDPATRVHRVVVYDGDRPVASGGLTRFDHLGFGFLWAGGTVPDARGRGAYTALMGARVRIAAARGLSHVGLYAKRDTSGPIVAAQGFFKAGAMAYWDHPAAG